MRKCLGVELPQTEYLDALTLQHALVEARINKTLRTDIFLLLEHAPVFTLGRRGGYENLTVPEAWLKKRGIAVIPTERGGNITFHGPGQIVGYPIIDLRTAHLNVVGYVEKLEEIMIRTVRDYGISAGRDHRNRGVWVGGNKIGSVGITVRHGLSFHGFALNVDLSLDPFTWINPCGLQGVGVTSMARESPHTPSPDGVRETVKTHFADILNRELVPTPLVDIQACLGSAQVSVDSENKFTSP